MFYKVSDSLRAVSANTPYAPKMRVDFRRGTWIILSMAGLGFVGLLCNAAWGWIRVSPAAADVRAGKELFTHHWSPNDPLSAAGDGLGPEFNARSCVECHFQGGTGGGGTNKHNVATFEVMPTIGHRKPTGGVIHAFSTLDELRESTATVRDVFPIVPKGVTITAICQAPLQKDYDPVRAHSINTPTLFGAGAIDKIPAVAIRSRHTAQSVSKIASEFHYEFDHAGGAGRVRRLPDGRIGKFGWKAQFATLEEFVANACAVEVGLTTPTRKQHLPQKHCEDSQAQPDLNEHQFQQLVSYIAALPAPRGTLPSESPGSKVIEHGRDVFTSVGCADCHPRDLGGAVGVYSDFCLHDLTDKFSNGYTETPEVPVPDDYPRQEEWKTPPLWGVADTAPYFHDGHCATLSSAIEAHGGQAAGVRQRYRHLPREDRDALLRFLGTLTTN